MLARILRASGLMLLLCGGARLPAAEGAPVQLTDDFSRNTLPAYQVEGDVAWEKGRVRLGPGAQLMRQVALGHTAEVYAVVRLAAGKEMHGLHFSLRDGNNHTATVALEAAAGNIVLLNLTEPREVVPLAGPKAPGHGSETAWALRFEVRRGVARAKAWRVGAPEPQDWQTSRYSGAATWPSREVAVFAREGAGGGVEVLSLRGVGPGPPRSKEQQTRAERAALLNNQAMSLSQRGKHREGMAQAREALRLCQEVLGPDHPNTATSLNNLGFLVQAQGGYAAARPYYEQALAIRKRVLGPDHPDTAASLNNLGGLLRTQGEYAAARPFYEQALAIQKKVLGPDHPGTATSLNNLGSLLQAQGEYTAARPYYEQALAIRKKVLGLEHPATATSLNNLGFLLTARGEYTAARPYFEQALAVRKRVLDPDHPDTATSLNNLASLLQAQGEYTAARPYYEQALAIRKKVLGPDHPDTAISLNNLGFLLAAKGEYAAARPCYEQALAIYENVLGPDHPGTPTSLNNLGALLEAQGEYAAARPYHEQALAIRQKTLGKKHPETAQSLNNLGGLLETQAEYAAARSYYEQALAIHQEVLGPDHPNTATSLNNLGGLLQAQGKYAAARPYYEQALAIRKRVLGPEHRDTANSLNNLGSLLKGQGEYAAARLYYEQALAIQKKVLGPDHPDTAASLNNLGCLLAAMGEHRQAWQHFQAANGSYIRLADTVLAASAERAHGSILGHWRPDFEVLLSFAEAAPAVAHDQGNALLTAVLGWKATSGRALTQRQEAVEVSHNAEAPQLYTELKQVRQHLARTLMRGPGTDRPAAHQAALQALGERRDTLERQLARLVEGFAAAQRARQAGPGDLAARLGPRAVLVEVVKYSRFAFSEKDHRKHWGPDRYAAVLLGRAPTPKGEPLIQLVPLGEARPIDAAVHAWRAAVQKTLVPPNVERELRERVWDPLAKALPQGTNRIVLAPDGELALLPFEAIRLADGQYLVERFQVSYVSNGRDLMPRPVPKQRPADALVLADPDYDDFSGRSPSTSRQSKATARRSSDVGQRLHFERLKGFAREADSVTKALQAAHWAVESRQGGAASEETLATSARPRLLYLITHGFFLPDLERKPDPHHLRGAKLVSLDSSFLPLPEYRENPRLRSGLALAGANRWKERAERGLSDGLLTALEVRDLDLHGTELVVLSACETGLGKVQVGEGVLGLRRAFQHAGAHTVLASLWQVPDVETEQLMTRFFQLWLNKAPKAEALRQSQLELIARLRADPTRRTAPPFFWAGFICHGRAE